MHNNKALKFRLENLPIKQQILWAMALVLAFLIFVHFNVSAIKWLIMAIVSFRWVGIGIDWLMFIHFLPVIILIITSILSIKYVLRIKIFRSMVLSLFIILASSLWFSIETANGFYQSYDDDYWTWWWYKNPETTARSEYTPTKYKYGYIDKTGHLVIEPIFDSAENFSEGLARIGFEKLIETEEEKSFAKQQMWWHGFGLPSFGKERRIDHITKYGYIDKTGEIVIEPKLRFVSDFSDGMAQVSYDGKYGYIDRQGKLVIGMKYDYSARDFHEGFAAVKIDDKSIYINKNGDDVFGKQFDDACDFSEGLALVEIDEKYGYINTSGDIVITPRFDNARDFSEGLAIIVIDDKWGFIDKTGEVEIQAQYDRTWGFNEGVAVVMVESFWECIWNYGVIDTSGEFIIEPSRRWITPFREGLARVSYENGWGYRKKYWSEWIDKKGNAVDHQGFYFSEGLARISVDGKYGYVDKEGQPIIEAQLDTTNNFSEGLASVGFEVVNEK